MSQRRTTVPGEASQLPVLTRFLQEYCTAAALPPAEALPFEIALEEIFMNVVMHGSPIGGLARVEVSVELVDDSFTLAVEDDGPEFDPLTLQAPDVTAPLGDRRVGGLGVYLVRQMMDAVSYARDGSHNRLSMTKRVVRRSTAAAGAGSGKFG